MKFYIKNGLDDFFEINQSPEVRITTFGLIAAVGGALALASGCAGDDTNPAAPAPPPDASSLPDGTTTSPVDAGPPPPLEKTAPAAMVFQRFATHQRNNFK